MDFTKTTAGPEPVGYNSLDFIMNFPLFFKLFEKFNNFVSM